MDKPSDYVSKKLEQLINAAKKGDDCMVAAMAARICTYIDYLDEEYQHK